MCVRAGSWSSQAEPAHFLYCIIPQAVCSLCKQAFPPRAARPGRGCAPGLAAQARAYSAASAPRTRPHRAARPRAPARRAPRFLLGHPRGGATRPYDSPSGRSPSPRGAGVQLGQKPREAAPRRARAMTLAGGGTGDPSSPPGVPALGTALGTGVGSSLPSGPKWGGPEVGRPLNLLFSVRRDERVGGGSIGSGVQGWVALGKRLLLSWEGA